MYLDPGFGGMLVQILVAVVAASGILIFSMRRKISNFFSRNKKVSNKTVENTAYTDAGAGSTDDVIDMIDDEKNCNEEIIDEKNFKSIDDSDK